MRIHFDYQVFHAQKFGGISNYFGQLFYQFDKLKEIDYSLSLLFSDNEHLNPSLSGSKKKYFPQRFFGAVNRLGSIYQIRKNNFDLLHPTYYHPYFLNVNLKKPFVVTVHDMTHEKFPHLFQDNTPQMKKAICRKATRIIAISEKTKEDLIDILKIPEKKIDVVYHGGNHFFPSEESIRPSLVQQIPEQFLLYVGSRMSYKNYELFTKAIVPVLKEYPDIHVVFTGKSLHPSEIEIFKTNNLLKQVVHVFPNQKELGILYKKAITFIFPSLYEGFGIPILEAYSNQCPVLLSDASCFPEIAGDAALYFEATQQESLTATVFQIIENVSLRSELIEKGNNRLSSFSWEATAKGTLATYSKSIN